MRYLKSVVAFATAVLSVYSIKVNTSFANDAPINLQGGGAQALSGPLTVSMESEVVKIILGKVSYTVDATFNFSNSGETVNLEVGFPKNGTGWIDSRFSQTSDFIKFETWVDGKQVNFIEKPNTASIEGHYTLPGLINHIKQTNEIEALNLMAKDYRWMVKEKVQFPSNKLTTTRVRYEAPYLNFGGECKGGLSYIYGTGSYWQGNIGESKFIVDATGIPVEDRPTEMSIDETDKNKMKCDTIGDGFLQCVLENYKPRMPDASVVVAVGCVDIGENQ